MLLAGFILWIIRAVYFACMITLTVYTLGQVYLLYTYFKNYRPRSNSDVPEGLPPVSEADLPPVTVQLPLYNERYVARRIIDAVAGLDYPRDRLHIQVLDDSTDDTTELIQARVAQLRAEGFNIELIHRTNRKGFKAGALAEAMPLTKSPFIAIFDADFVPSADFLRKTIPFFFQDEKIGVVQSRWGHLNEDDNLITHSQALAIDGHFAVEQQARSQGNLIFSFNGTGGIWRRDCIEDAGGWQADTLTEDFDLSYRAQIKHWRFVFVRDVVVPGELPPQMKAYRNQQARWAKGSTQVFLKMAMPLLRSDLSIRKRYMGLVQLFQYTIQPVMLLAMVLTPFMIMNGMLTDVSITPAFVMGLGGPFLCLLGQQALYPNWQQRTLRFPLLILFSTGLLVNNSRAAISGLLGHKSEFTRTPKFHLLGKSDSWRRSQYVSLVGNEMLWEFGFGIYTVICTVIALNRAPSFALYFLLYAAGFWSVALWDLYDKLSLQRPVRTAVSTVASVKKTEVEPIRQPGR